MQRTRHNIESSGESSSKNNEQVLQTNKKSKSSTSLEKTPKSTQSPSSQLENELPEKNKYPSGLAQELLSNESLNQNSQTALSETKQSGYIS